MTEITRKKDRDGTIIIFYRLGSRKPTFKISNQDTIITGVKVAWLAWDKVHDYR